MKRLIMGAVFLIFVSPLFAQVNETQPPGVPDFFNPKDLPPLYQLLPADPVTFAIKFGNLYQQPQNSTYMSLAR